MDSWFVDISSTTETNVTLQLTTTNNDKKLIDSILSVKIGRKMLPGNCISVPDTLFYMKYWVIK